MKKYLIILVALLVSAGIAGGVWAAATRDKLSVAAGTNSFYPVYDEDEMDSNATVAYVDQTSGLTPYPINTYTQLSAYTGAGTSYFQCSGGFAYLVDMGAINASVVAAGLGNGSSFSGVTLHIGSGNTEAGECVMIAKLDSSTTDIGVRGYPAADAIIATASAFETIATMTTGTSTVAVGDTLWIDIDAQGESCTWLYTYDQAAVSAFITGRNIN